MKGAPVAADERDPTTGATGDRTDAAPRAAVGRHDDPQSPWRTLAAREVYRNPWISVTEYQVVRPDGQPGIYGVVDPGDNAAIVALDAQQRVTLVDPLLAARRELAEETGLEADEWAPLGAYYLSSGISTQTSYAYLARGLRSVPARPEGTERLTLRSVPLAEAHRMCLRNEIRDAPSVMALWRAWELLRDEGA